MYLPDKIKLRPVTAARGSEFKSRFKLQINEFPGYCDVTWRACPIRGAREKWLRDFPDVMNDDRIRNELKEKYAAEKSGN